MKLPTCDECKKPIEKEQARYAGADKFDDDGVCYQSRHWDCHIPFDKRLADLKKRVMNLTRKIKDSGL